MTQSHRPAHPALALASLALLLGGEWGRVSVRPSARALLMLGDATTTASPAPPPHRWGG